MTDTETNQIRRKYCLGWVYYEKTFACRSTRTGKNYISDFKTILVYIITLAIRDVVPVNLAILNICNAEKFRPYGFVACRFGVTILWLFANVNNLLSYPSVVQPVSKHRCNSGWNISFDFFYCSLP